MATDIKFALVVPCYNEQEVLPDSNAKLIKVLEQLENDKLIGKGRILYIDDGSKDSTWQIIKQLSSESDRIIGIKLAHNVGHQNALWAGLEKAAEMKFDATVSIDADLQDDTDAIAEMVKQYNAGYDIVYGVRKERDTDTFFKRFTAQSFYRLMMSMGGEIIYNHADFRLMSLRSLRALISYPERNLFLRGMVKSIGFPYTCVYYDRKLRLAGESKYPLAKMINFAFDGITSFSVKPLRLITSIGILFMVISAAFIIYGLVRYITHSVIEGWTSLMLSLWFIGGAILTSLGIIGEYIGKIYREVKCRPRYFIEETIQKSDD
ncbi:MAG: glycosyltransferase family 2 protein [Bacteroidales bacterium]|nr:glycosyltransferase family 2 protein [Bacteroidales bacterium]